MTRIMTRQAVIVASAVALLHVGPAVSAQSQRQLPHLFEIAGAQDARGLTAPPNALAVAYVRVNVDALGPLEGPTEVMNQRADRVSAVAMDLLDRGQVVALRDRVEQLSSGRYAWTGRLEGIDLSAVAMVIDRDAGTVYGTVSMPSGVYQIRPVAGGVHAVFKLDPAGEKPDIVVPRPVPPADRPETDQQLSPTGDSGARIDVMAVWTPNARIAAGGMTAIQNLIDLAVTETNQIYANSGIAPRVRLVYKGEISYTESGSAWTDLSRLQNPSDGYIDSVHALRNAYGADMVSMIIDGSRDDGGNLCGIAYTIGGASTANAPYAFQVTGQNCATGYYSFGHEFGHLQGAAHDWFADSTDYTSINGYKYNHGYYNLTGAWRTVMAYNDACSYYAGEYCTRLPYFSNPGVTYGGLPVGSTSTATPADNHTVLNNTAYYVANFRAEILQVPSLTQPTGTVSTNTPTYTWNPVPGDVPPAVEIQRRLG